MRNNLETILSQDPNIRNVPQKYRSLIPKKCYFYGYFDSQEETKRMRSLNLTIMHQNPLMMEEGSRRDTHLPSGYAFSIVPQTMHRK